MLFTYRDAEDVVERGRNSVKKLLILHTLDSDNELIFQKVYCVQYDLFSSPKNAMINTVHSTLFGDIICLSKACSIMRKMAIIGILAAVTPRGRKARQRDVPVVADRCTPVGQVSTARCVYMLLTPSYDFVQVEFRKTRFRHSRRGTLGHRH